MCYIESDKYLIRLMTDNDRNDVKNIIMSSKVFNTVAEAVRAEDELDYKLVIEDFMKTKDKYVVINKAVNEIIGFIEKEDCGRCEGELSINLKEPINIRNILEFFSALLETNGVDTRKEYSIYYIDYDQRGELYG